MRILPRRFWWTALLGLVANTSISLHILVKSTPVQALQPPYHFATRATWEGYTKTNFESIFPDGETACNSFKILFDTPTTLEGTKLEYFEDGAKEGEVYQNRCYLKSLINGQYYNYDQYASRVNCPNAVYPERYIYTGGINGVCILSSKLQANNNKKPDWCTGISGTWGININFTPACRNHDLCYWTIGATKSSCDEKFYSDLKSSCPATSDPATCNQLADYYYQFVSGKPVQIPLIGKFFGGTIGNFGGARAKKGYEKAQQEAKDVRTYLEKRFGKNAVGVEYNEDIAWELASRQATREDVDTSKINAGNSIATNLFNR